MWVSSLKLAGFRNYSHLDVKLNQGMTLFFGDNGNGKTNLVEAIYYLSNLDSHRNSDTKALINKDSQAATAIAEIRNKDRNLLLAAEINSSQPNKYFINGNQQKKTSDFLGVLNSVIFAPEDLDLVRRDPSDRRRFLDLSLTQLKPRMAGVKADYERVLKQRNALLKSAKNFPSVDLSTLDIWDQQLVELGNQISMARLSLIQNLKPLLQKFYSALAGTDEVVDLALEMNIG
ncbi:MAG: DNA replication and repair protein RecF, partial [Actinobacteria bacterium]|nr:DNA replication and repair protein RecF [Actinomycetota bacterium]